MDCCGLSSTGLKNVDANEVISDNITVLSNLNISGYSFLNNALIKNNSTFLSTLNVSGFTTLNNKTTILSSLNVSGFTSLNNKTTLLSSLNVSGFTTLDNDTNINGSLNISGLNVLNVLNSFGTNITNLNNSITQNQNQINIHETGLSTLYNFRSDNEDALVKLIDGSIVIHSPFETLFESAISNSNAATGILPTAILTKIDETGKLNVFHPSNILLPNKSQGFWVVHDEIEGFHQQAIINAAKFLLHDGGIEAAGTVALTAAQGVAAITLYLGF